MASLTRPLVCPLSSPSVHPPAVTASTPPGLRLILAFFPHTFYLLALALCMLLPLVSYPQSKIQSKTQGVGMTNDSSSFVLPSASAHSLELLYSSSISILTNCSKRRSGMLYRRVNAILFFYSRISHFVV
ncbi:hypothetical protein OE88DRAFT_327852 [Heliocybe sulcata]|uniref:Uncharacterized protein n=1 Tax=Heliocybe sulcata TaxID=5364 RepID=A0A5C3N119_9AGAM|nr:hypothetical protein OE88DRAFT_327852 [Heliocybe sulcata]